MRRLPPLKALPAFEIAASHLSFSAAAAVCKAAILGGIDRLSGYGAGFSMASAQR
jgi:hypothetical protein